jgi:hypothetical protein
MTAQPHCYLASSSFFLVERGRLDLKSVKRVITALLRSQFPVGTGFDGLRGNSHRKECTYAKLTHRVWGSRKARALTYSELSQDSHCYFEEYPVVEMSSCSRMIQDGIYPDSDRYCTISTKCYRGVTRYGSNSPLGELPDLCEVLRIKI